MANSSGSYVDSEWPMYNQLLVYCWLEKAYFLALSDSENNREVTQEILNRILGSILGIIGSGLITCQEGVEVWA